MAHCKIPASDRTVGFTASFTPKGHPILSHTKRTITSDAVEFHHYMKDIDGTILNRVGLLSNQVSNFLFLHHADLSADLYTDESIELQMVVLAKKSVRANEPVGLSKIADVRSVRFNKIPIADTDSVICCLKVGWKFVLHFDFSPADEETAKGYTRDLQTELGCAFRYLLFQAAYDSVGVSDNFKSLITDGWFPFIELLPDDFDTLLSAYDEPQHKAEIIAHMISSFSEKRIAGITERWWANSMFLEKKALLNAGIKAFLMNTPDGDINCISTLMPQIEGIIRLKFLAEKQYDEKDTGHLTDYLSEKGKDKTGSEQSLLFPRDFVRYLRKVIFKPFKLETNETPLSRHSGTHGVASPEDYTRTRALQLILILDQIGFYL